MYIAFVLNYSSISTIIIHHITYTAWKFIL